MRGDKRRTIRVGDNRVTDHELNKATSYKEYAKGNLDGFIH
jgi:protein subunit release factor A